MKKKLLVFFLILIILFGVGISLYLNLSITYDSAELFGGVELVNSSITISGYQMGTDSIFGFLYDFERDTYFSIDGTLMAGNIIENRKEEIWFDSISVSEGLNKVYDWTIIQDVTEETSNYGIEFEYLVVGKKISGERYSDIKLNVAIEITEYYDFSSYPQYINFYSSIDNEDEIENYISLFKTAKSVE